MKLLGATKADPVLSPKQVPQDMEALLLHYSGVQKRGTDNLPLPSLVAQNVGLHCVS